MVGEATGVAARETGAVTITLEVQRLPSGPHGVHIHDVGKCEPPGFASAGGHFNADAKQHGLENSNGPHNGDLPNLIVGADGTGTLSTVNSRLVDLPRGENIFHGDGVAFVIHAGPDDQKTDPSGNSGARIACGAFIHD